jgi:hypothetical protein
MGKLPRHDSVGRCFLVATAVFEGQVVGRCTCWLGLPYNLVAPRMHIVGRGVYVLVAGRATGCPVSFDKGHVFSRPMGSGCLSQVTYNVFGGGRLRGKDARPPMGWRAGKRALSTTIQMQSGNIFRI